MDSKWIQVVLAVIIAAVVYDKFLAKYFLTVSAPIAASVVISNVKPISPTT